MTSITKIKRSFQGKVVSSKMDKSIVVLLERNTLIQ